MKQLIAIYKPTGELVEVHSSVLCSFVMFYKGEVASFLMAELGGQTNFEILGEL